MRSILKRRGVRWLLELIVVALIYFGVRTYMQWDLASGPVPNIQTTTLSGQHFDITAPRKGPLLVHFWATWCPVCRLEQNDIQALSRKYSVMTIAMQSGDQDAVRVFMQKEGLSFPVINDPNGELAREFGVTAVPVSFVVDRKNRIRFVERGYTTAWGLRLRMWLGS